MSSPTSRNPFLCYSSFSPLTPLSEFFPLFLVVCLCVRECGKQPSIYLHFHFFGLQSNEVSSFSRQS
uniref:Proteasome subunit alpha type n=1 Tax=Rhizophora mucronata TaxID=61149 RepID=A0A2P2NS72_RHIMU